MSAATFVVTIRDKRGDPVHVYGVCAHHADEDVYVQRAIRKSGSDGWTRVEETRPDNFTVQRIGAGGSVTVSWSCDACEGEDVTAQGVAPI